MSCGIYKITNLINGHSYIGESINIERRWKEHKSIPYKASIYDAFQKYGIENFSFEIIEECSIEEFFEREKYWISFYDTYKNGYNMTKGGEGGPACGHRRKVIQYDINGNFIALYDSITQAEKELGIKNSNITRVCQGKAYEANGFQWRYFENNKNYKENIGKSLRKQKLRESAIKNICNKNSLYNQIAQCNKESHNIIKIFNSIKEASIATGTTMSGIYRTLSGERKSAGGYYWMNIDK